MDNDGEDRHTTSFFGLCTPTHQCVLDHTFLPVLVILIILIFSGCLGQQQLVPVLMAILSVSLHCGSMMADTVPVRLLRLKPIVIQ